MLIVTGTIELPVAELPRFLEEVAVLTAAARQRDGNLAYEIAVLDAAGGRLLVAERWRDAAALAAHMHAEETLAFVSGWQDKMQSHIRKYDATNERSLME